MLKLEPEQRPTAREVLEMVHKNRSLRLKRQVDPANRDKGPDHSEKRRHSKIQRTQSALYKFDVPNITLSPVPGLPANIKIKQVAFIKVQLHRC